MRQNEILHQLKVNSLKGDQMVQSLLCQNNYHDQNMHKSLTGSKLRKSSGSKSQRKYDWAEQVAS